MKYSFLIIAIFIMFSCGKNTTTEVEESPEWISFKGNTKEAKAKKVVLISGDEEYRSEEALPMLAKILSERHGFDCTVLFSQDPDTLGIVAPNHGGNIQGLEALDDADLMILFTRFRALPDEQMAHFENYLNAGKPIIAIRTATHAFHFKDTTHNYYHWGNYYNGKKEDWKGGFGRKILGANWYWHHGHHKHQSTRGVFAEGATEHDILKGIEDGSIWGSTDVYGMPLPLPDDAQPIVLGQVINRAGEYDGEDVIFGMRETDTELAETTHTDKYHPNEPLMPIVWSKSYQIDNHPTGKTITSTIGASSDMLDEEVRRLFVNATYHLLDLDVPEKADVAFVGDYQPSQYSFKSDEYWKEKNIVIKNLK